MDKPTKADIEAATLLLGHAPLPPPGRRVRPGRIMDPERVQSAVLLRSQLISMQEAMRREGIDPKDSIFIVHPDTVKALDA